MTITKKCKRCKNEKDLSEFSNKKGGKFGKNSLCKLCDTIYQKEWRDKNPNRQRRITERSSLRRIIARAFVNNIKTNNSCCDCGLKYEAFVMEFDHLDDKLMDVSTMVNKGFSLEKIQNEISKTDLVCVLCHRNRTFNRIILTNNSMRFTDRKKNELYSLCEELKNNPCEICGKQYNHWQMDWDHIDPTSKIDTISNLIQQRVGKETLINEIKKCQLLCAVCHRRKTNNHLELSHQSEQISSNGKSGSLGSFPFHLM